MPKTIIFKGGVQLNLKEVYKRYAKILAKPVEDLDDREKDLAIDDYLEMFNSAIAGSTVKKRKRKLRKEEDYN